MMFRCEACGSKITTRQVAGQTVRPMQCAGDSHRGPFARVDPAAVETRPEHVETRKGVEA